MEELSMLLLGEEGEVEESRLLLLVAALALDTLRSAILLRGSAEGHRAMPGIQH